MVGGHGTYGMFPEKAVIAGRRHVYMHDRVVYMYACPTTPGNNGSERDEIE